jgi:peptide/nickel transport system substrate-binding protein
MVLAGQFARNGRFGRLAAMVALIVLLCGGLPAAPVRAGARAVPGVAGRELVVAMPTEVGQLDPQLSTSLNNIAATFQLFDNLTTRDLDLKLQPQLATEWRTVNETTWEFKLRPGVKFHNGDPLTSADVKFTIERTYDPAAKTVVATVFTTVDTIETPDDLTVLFHTKRPDPLLPARLAYYGGQILPKGYFTEVGPDAFAAQPIGSGPFKFAEWVKGERLTLQANPDYWGGAPDPAAVSFRVIPDPEARVAALITGSADLITKFPVSQISTATVRRGSRARPTPGCTCWR